MVIERSTLKVSRLVGTGFPRMSRESMSSANGDDGEVQKGAAAMVVRSDDEFDDDDADSGAGSDDFDLLELGESMAEFCQIGNQTCIFPFELYDLQNLSDVLSLDVWNECLTEEDRFGLTKYLPDMDQGTYMLTLKELFSGSNFHFGSPILKIFEMLKGGVCEPRVALYRQGLNFVEKRKYYHRLRKHHNDMVGNMYQIKEAWINCRGYSIEEKLRVLNTMKSEKSMMREKMEDLELESHSSGKEESDDALWNQMVKERELGLRMGHNLVRSTSPGLGLSPQGRPMALESVNYGNRNSKGTVKLAGVKTPSTREFFPSGNHGMDLMYGSKVAAPQQNIPTGYDLGPPIRMREHLLRDHEDNFYNASVQRGQNLTRGVTIARPGVLKMGKKHDHLKGDEFGPDNFTGSPMLLKNGAKKTVNQLSDIEVLTAKPSNTRPSYPFGKKANYNEYMQHYDYEDKMKYLTSPARELPSKGNRTFVTDRPDQFLSRKAQGENLFMDPQFNYGDWNVGNKFKSASGPQMNDRLLLSDYKANLTLGKIRGKSIHSGGGDRFAKSEETESDSSEQPDDEETSNPLLMSKSVFSNGQSSFPKPGRDPKNTKRKIKVENAGASEGFGSESYKPELFSKAIQKGKMRDRSHLNGQLHSDQGDMLQRPLMTSERAELMQRGVSLNHSMRHSSHLHNFTVDGKDDLYETRILEDDNRQDRLPTKGTKKRKGKDGMMYMDGRDQYDYLQSESLQHIDDSVFLRKQDRLKGVADSGFVDGVTFEPPTTEADVTDPEVETKPSKKPFPLITPTVHTGFSFSIIHLLSAVRMALTTPHLEDPMEIRKQPEQNPSEDQTKELEGNNGLDPQGNVDTQASTLPSLTVQEIVNRVRSNPGDPCILETQEPLQDLVRGVMKIFSSRTAPLGAKGWKPLVLYEKSSKGWSWIGPVSQSSLEHEVIEEVTSPETWGLPYKMLVKLVDAFANWLKSSQETLQQIGNLPAPPESLLQFNSDEKDRFKDLRVQKSLNTINPCSDEVRAYFRQEEILRYSIPDRAYSYTAADGKKSIVAPLRRCGGKPTSKARDHFMLKRDRPPHVTILCLVRDAASRLPGSIGTRADVCTLIRDSQFIVEDVSDAQVNQVVSGALDRLHYERDPCVQFDSERKLWVYLHKDREEEDFEDDGTSSTKKWKRQKKDVEVEQIDQGGAVTVAFQSGTEEQQTGFDMCTDLNAEPSPNMMTDDKGVDLVYDERMEQNQQMGWEALGLNPTNESNLVCQENVTNEDFD